MAKRGRPARGEFFEKRSNLSTRITSELRKRLDEAAQDSGRSLSQEIEMRLVRSFDEQDNLTVKNFGRQPYTYSIFRIAAEIVKDVEAWTGGYWLKDRFTFDIATDAMSALFESFEPEGSREPPEVFPTTPDLSAWPDLKRRLRSRLMKQPVRKLAYPIAAGAVARVQGATAYAGRDNKFETVWRRAAEHLGPKLTKPVLPLPDEDEGSHQ